MNQNFYPPAMETYEMEEFLSDIMLASCSCINQE